MSVMYAFTHTIGKIIEGNPNCLHTLNRYVQIGRHNKSSYLTGVGAKTSTFVPSAMVGRSKNTIHSSSR